MTEPTQMNPSPSAVPWTPDMNPQAGPAPAPAPYQQAPMQQPPVQPHMAPQQAGQAPMPQSAVPYGQPQHQPQHQQHQMAPQHHAPQRAPQNPMQQGQHQPYMPPPQQMQPQTQHGAPQHIAPPPLAPHMQQARQQLTPQDPRSAINQVPPIQQAEPVAAAKPKSGSLLNKNFFLGAITGLVVGAFVLPTLLGMFFGDSSADVRAQAPTQAQSPVREIASFDPNAPALEEGATFLDEALAADAP